MRGRALAGGVAAACFAALVAVAVIATVATLPPIAIAGRTSAPPWSAPTDVVVRADDAGLVMLGREGTRLHIHTHLSISVDGKPVVVPAHIGIDVPAKRYSPLHTHDTSGIVHIESPVLKTFFLGQVFAEWNVRLAPGRIGSYVDGESNTAVTVFVDGQRFEGDPTRIRLADLEDVDFVVTTRADSPTAVPPPAFAWPSNYH